MEGREKPADGANWLVKLIVSHIAKKIGKPSMLETD